ncbi:MAG: PD-(D/E)XK nuclease family protein [Clostridia bacterium]
MSGRPYARIPGSEPSVTTIIGDMLAKPGLPWAAARETALFAVHHQDEWADLSPDQAVERLRRHHRGVWDSRAAMGTALHAVNEAWCRGAVVDLGDLVVGLIDTERTARMWAGREDEIVSSLDGYVAGLERFWDAWAPSTVRSEYCVRQAGVYVGTADWLADVSGRRLVLDLKTTAQPDAERGVYHDSWALQLAAYRWAPERVEYGDPAAGGPPTEIAGGPNEAADGAAVVLLRGDGEFSFFEVDASREMHQAFMWLANARSRLRALPVPAPILPGVAA